MELTLLGSVAVVAFLVGGGATLLFMAFRRTVALRGALLNALRRIDKLEKQIAAGVPIAANGAVAPTPAPEAAATQTQTPPALDFAGADQTYDEAVQAAMDETRIDPPHIAILVLFSAISAAAALGGARVDAISSPAGVGIAAIVGFATLLAAEWRLRVDRRDKKTTTAPAIAALLGLTITLATVLFGWGALKALDPTIALTFAAVLGLAAAVLSMRYGPSLRAFALIAAGGAPALAPMDTNAPIDRYLLLALLLGVMMVLRRRGAAPFWTWIAAAIALGWGFNGAAWGGGIDHVGALGAYFVVLLIAALVYAWEAAATPLPFPAFWRAFWRVEAREPMLVAHLLAFGAAAGLTLTVLAHPAPLAATGAALAAFVFTAALAANLRQGFWLPAFFAVLASASCIAFWPALDQERATLIALTAGLAATFVAAGSAMLRFKESQPGAALAALSPILILAAAFTRAGNFVGPEYWAFGALAIAALNALAYWQAARMKSVMAGPFAAGAALGIAVAFYVATPTTFAPLALAFALPLIALGDRFRNERGLRLAALGLGVFLVLRIAGPEFFIPLASSPAMLAIVFLVSAGAAFLAALFFTHPSGAPSGTSDACLALALTLVAGCCSFEARHLFTGEQIGAPYAILAEIGLNTLVWLGLATFMAWRYGPKPAFHIYAFELVIFTAATAHALIAGGVILNPWWGPIPAPAPGWDYFNVIELAFAAPALLLFLYTWLRAQHRMELRFSIAFAAGLIMLLLAIVLEIRRLFHGAAMARAPVSMSEAWAYSGAMLVFALVLLLMSAERGGRVLRIVSLGLALAALTKMALSDLGALQGLPRLGASLAIGAAGGALVWFYRRTLWPALLPRAAQPKTLPKAQEPKLEPRPEPGSEPKPEPAPPG